MKSPAAIRKALTAARAAWRKARARLRSIREKIADSRPGSDRRDKLRGQQAFWNDRLKWTLKRKTVLRRKLKKAKEERTPTPASWQANGHEWGNLTPKAKELLAIAVVTYDCYCTSITRGWGTGSFHERVPTHGFDCGGTRMVEFQRALRYGHIDGFPLSSILELFGPDNAACADNGAPYVMSEGSDLENLHDNHVHAFVY